MDEIDLTRAETMQPRGYNPHRITEPPVDVDWQDVVTYVPLDPGDVPAVLPRRVVKDVIRDLGAMRLAADMVAAPGKGKRVESRGLAEEMSREAHRLQRLLLQFLGGALAALLLAVGLVAAAPMTRAQAAEGPQPDVSATYRVTLGPAPVRLLVQAAAVTPVAPGWFCGSVWTARGMLARSCSIGPTFQIPVTIDPRTWPAGRSFAQVVDDSSDVAVSTIVFDARRPSRFGVGTFTDMGRGDLAVRVPVTLYSPTLGRWVGQSRSPVQVQEATRRGWRTRATLWTNPPGLAVGTVHLGGGVHVIRVVRPLGATVWGTTGRTRIVTVTTEPLDIN